MDRYRGVIAGCLKDSSTLVRRQTLTLLTNLIKEAFLKWEGEIIYRLVSSLLDPCTSIRDFAKFCLVGLHDRAAFMPSEVLLGVSGACAASTVSRHVLSSLHRVSVLLQQRHASLLVSASARSIGPRCFATSAHFVTFAAEAAVTGESMAKSMAGNDLKGEVNENSRMYLYKFMVGGIVRAKSTDREKYSFQIKQLSDYEKFSICAKISQEVFGAVTEGTINFDDEGVPALVGDALRVCVYICLLLLLLHDR